MWAKTNKILEDTTFIFGNGFGFDLETRGCYGTTVCTCATYRIDR